MGSISSSPKKSTTSEDGSSGKTSDPTGVIGSYTRPTKLITPAISLLDSPYVQQLHNPLVDEHGRYVSFANRVIICWYRRICQQFDDEMGFTSDTSDSESVDSVDEDIKQDMDEQYGVIRRSFPILPIEIQNLMASFCAPAAELVPVGCTLHQSMSKGVKWVGSSVLRMCHALEGCNQMELSLLLEMIVDETSKYAQIQGHSLKALDLAKNPSPFSKEPFIGISFIQTLFGLKIVKREVSKQHFTQDYIDEQNRRLKSAKSTITKQNLVSTVLSSKEDDGSDETDVYGCLDEDDDDDDMDGEDVSVIMKKDSQIKDTGIQSKNKQYVITLVRDDEIIQPMLGNIQAIWFDSNHMDYWQMCALIHALLQWPNVGNLSVLNLSGNPIGDMGLAMIVDTVILDECSHLRKGHTSSFSGLTKLYLSNIGATDTGIEYMSELILNDARKQVNGKGVINVVLNCHPGISNQSVYCLEHLILNSPMDMRGRLEFSICVSSVSIKIGAYLRSKYDEFDAENDSIGMDQYMLLKKCLGF